MRLQFGIVYCLYDDHEYLRLSLEPIYPFVDKVLFLMSDVPWNGAVSDNSETRSVVNELCRTHPKCELLTGHWENEIEQRNFGLARFCEWGIDYCFIVDSDEIYEPKQFANIIKFIVGHQQAAAFHIEWNTYWKKSLHVISPRESYRPVIAVRCNSFSFNVIRGGTTAVKRTGDKVIPSGEGYNALLVPPELAICHHLSYARDDEYMRRKLETNSHAKDFIPGWYENVWLKWTPEMENLHPIVPEQYGRAVEIDSLPLELPRRED